MCGSCFYVGSTSNTCTILRSLAHLLHTLYNYMGLLLSCDTTPSCYYGGTLMYSFEHRDEIGFAIEVEEDGDPLYIGQVYGDADTFRATTVQAAEIKFQSIVDKLLDEDDDD